MPQYPVNTGETTFVKDSLDSKVKLLDTVIQLLRAADSAEASARESAISALQAALSTLETDVDTAQSKADSAYSLAQTANSNANSSYVMKRNQSNTPSSNNSYNLGSSSYQWANVFSRAMTIGREGYEWDINTNDGYITLPGNGLIHWGYVSSSSNPIRVTFTPAFLSRPMMVVTRNYPGESNPTPHEYFPVIGKLSTSGAYISCYEMTSSVGYSWIAIGETSN